MQVFSFNQLRCIIVPGNINWWRDFENSLTQLNISYYANMKGNLYNLEYIKEGSIEKKQNMPPKKLLKILAKIRDL